MTTTEITPSSLEKTLLHPMSLMPRVAMDETMSVTFLRISMMQKTQIDGLYKQLLEKSWVIKSLEKRINHCLTISIDKKTISFIYILTDGIIGQCILYLYYLQYWAKKNNRSSIDFDTLSILVFPMGFICSEKMQECWDMQKYEEGNMIDNEEAAISIM